MASESKVKAEEDIGFADKVFAREEDLKYKKAISAVSFHPQRFVLRDELQGERMFIGMSTWTLNSKLLFQLPKLRVHTKEMSQVDPLASQLCHANEEQGQSNRWF